MKITALEKAKGNRYTVYVDDEYWYILDLEIILQNSIQVGMEVDEEELDHIRSLAERRTARERAYYLLGYRDHSEKELYEKLLKSARPEIAAEMIALLKEQGLLDDRKYAQKLARYYLESKKWGRRKALYEMRRRGIDTEVAEEALDDLDVDSRAQIQAVVDRKYSVILSEGGYRGRQRVFAALSRMGYSYDDIKAVLAGYTAEDE